MLHTCFLVFLLNEKINSNGSGPTARIVLTFARQKTILLCETIKVSKIVDIFMPTAQFAAAFKHTVQISPRSKLAFVKISDGCFVNILILGTVNSVIFQKFLRQSHK